MINNSNTDKETGEIITLKDNNWLKRQKIAGEAVIKVHQEVFSMVKSKAQNLTRANLDDCAKNIIEHENCIPVFYKYRNFPYNICASLNNELVHGISNRNIPLKDGDVLKIDVGASFEGAIADCAVTYIYGKPKDEVVVKLLKSCQEALNESIEAFKPGNRIGAIGNIIFQKSVKDNFGVVTSFGGHGICYDKIHADPFIQNKSRKQEGVMIRPGMAIAIEPMFVIGKNTNTKLLPDKWTVITRNISAHFEHSVTLDENGNSHIITDHGINVENML